MTKYAANILLNWALRVIVDQNFSNNHLHFSKALMTIVVWVIGYWIFSLSVLVVFSKRGKSLWKHREKYLKMLLWQNMLQKFYTIGPQRFIADQNFSNRLQFSKALITIVLNSLWVWGGSQSVFVAIKFFFWIKK